MIDLNIETTMLALVAVSILAIIFNVAFIFIDGIESNAGRLDSTTRGMFNMLPVIAFSFPVIYVLLEFSRKKNEYEEAMK